jgi:MFS family permease
LLYFLLTAAFVFGAGAIVAGAFHIVPMLLDARWTSSAAARAAAMLGIGVVAGRLAIGWSLDRMAPILVTQVSFALGALGWAMLSVGWGMPVAALLVGLALGAESDILAFLVARYFGLDRFGFLYASAYAVVGVASTVGPVAAGYARDRSGSYESAGIAAVAMLLIAIGILGVISRLVSRREMTLVKQT